MKELKYIIAKNITSLRQAHRLTQAELAEKLSYSDKSVSKWERGEAIPDVAVLIQIAELFGVSVDYLLNEQSAVPMPKAENKRIKLIITALAVITLWFAATVLFVSFKLSDIFPKTWMIFAFCVPLTAVIVLIFNSIWRFAKGLNFFIISVLCWSFLACMYLIFMDKNPWLIFIIGVPAQIAILLCSRITKGDINKK